MNGCKIQIQIFFIICLTLLFFIISPSHLLFTLWKPEYPLSWYFFLEHFFFSLILFCWSEKFISLAYIPSQTLVEKSFITLTLPINSQLKGNSIGLAIELPRCYICYLIICSELRFFDHIRARPWLVFSQGFIHKASPL
jgi:hypothetical protein